MKKPYIILQDEADTKTIILILIKTISAIALDKKSVQIKAAGSASASSFVLNYLCDEEANIIFNNCVKSIEDFYTEDNN